MRLLIVSDCGVPTGYGRIADEIGTRLHQRGHEIVAASFAYDGLLPPRLNMRSVLPYHVATLQNNPNEVWAKKVGMMARVTNPELVLVIQDMPYAEALYYLSNIDWSVQRFGIITPVDGTPISPTWLRVMQQADLRMTISEFGVQAYRNQGISVGLCRPGIDPNYFVPRNAVDRADLRAKVGIAQETFVVGTMSQNQGRKAIPHMMEMFFAFAKDKPNARYLLDCERVSPAGWNLPELCAQNDWPMDKIIFRDQINSVIPDLADRYNLLDAFMLISHREGYGIPLVEAMACGVPVIAMDYCSGTEICGDTGGQRRGLLVPPIEYFGYSTWGGAYDRFPRVDAGIEALEILYGNHGVRANLSHYGREWARTHTWDSAADSLENLLNILSAQIHQEKVSGR